MKENAKNALEKSMTSLTREQKSQTRAVRSTRCDFSVIKFARSSRHVLLVGSTVGLSLIFGGCANTPKPPVESAPSIHTEADNARRASELPHTGPTANENADAAASGRQASTTTCNSNAFIWPVNGPVLSHFGADGTRAILIGGDAGGAVRAAGGGRVVYVGDQIQGYGLLVIIKHRNGYITAYGYNQTVLVKEGSEVKRGQTIALIGGRSQQQPSSLFELRKDREPIDPIPHLSSCTP